jgi:hypothetical protein
MPKALSACGGSASSSLTDFVNTPFDIFVKRLFRPCRPWNFSAKYNAFAATHKRARERIRLNPRAQ